MKTIDFELIVGVLLLSSIAVLVYASLHLGQMGFGQTEGYTVQAEFTNAGGLQDGAAIELAGVKIGRVTRVQLTDTYRARVTLSIKPTVVLKEDAKAAIKSAGLIGERYIEILPGTTANQIAPGGNIRNTEAPVDIQETITKFIFGNVETNTASPDGKQ
jgi:phospholipid/cholesterol/gamma-HCH transport system substrate-binding protein